MTFDWSSRRRWQQVDIQRTATGYEILLDGRPLRTPRGNSLLVPTEMLARGIAGEWSGVQTPPNAASFQMTRLANTALDLTDGGRATMVESLLGYLSSDVICYRASEPPDLVQRQQESWDPILEHYRKDWGVECVITTGIMPVTQPQGLRDAVQSRLIPMNDFELVVMTEQVTLSSSPLLVMALRQGWIGLEETWQRAQLDIDWQRERWGADDEDGLRLAAMQKHFLQASTFLAASLSEDRLPEADMA